MNQNSKKWVMDSGSSYHMCPRREWFKSYEAVNGGKVLMGNNIACSIVGIDTISIRMFDGTIKTLMNMRHVPELKRNLISFRTFDDSGHAFKVEKGQLKVSKGILVVMRSVKRNSL